MSTRVLISSVVLSLFIGVSIFGIGLTYLVESVEQDKCLVDYPRRIIGGKFERYSNLWDEDIVLHRLFYSGKMSKTDKVCEVSLWVTKAEYEDKLCKE